MKEIINVSIVEDNKFIRQGWEEILLTQSDIKVMGSYPSAEAALESTQIFKSDIILMDIGLPGKSGIEAVKIITKKKPEINIVMISVYEDDQNIYDAICNGAVGYLHKRVSPEKLIEAIKSAHDGGSPMSPNIARKVIATFKTHNKNQESVLSERESEVLNHLSQGKSYRTMAADMYLSVDGIRYHIRNIYEKLQVNSRSEAISEGFKKKLI